MTTEANKPLTFAYRAKTPDGQAISGTIDAMNITEAGRKLASLQLVSVQIEPAGVAPPRPGLLHRTMGGDDFVAFNQQLAQLTGAGLPVEQGLRLIAAELRRGAMKRTLDTVAAELESGKSLPQAIEAHRSEFPPLYAELVDAGIRAGNLPGILLNLGRHLTLVRRLQAMLWRTLSYPILILMTFLVLSVFLLTRVMPQFENIFAGFHTQLPGITMFVLGVSNVLRNAGFWNILTGVGVVTASLFALLWTTGSDRAVAEGLMLHLPIIGAVLRRNLISRWCDAVGLGVEAGMDLPAAVAMADDAMGSSALKADGQAIVAALSEGRAVSDARVTRILPPMVMAGIELSSARNDLPAGLRTLSTLYQQQAEFRLGAVAAMLSPVLMLFMGCFVAVLTLAMFAPFISLIETVSGPHH